MSSGYGSTVSKLRNDANSLRHQLGWLSNSADSTSNWYTTEFLNTLELGMTTVYKLAVLLRGDYDNSPQPNSKAQQDYVMSMMVQYFNIVETYANNGLQKLQESSKKIVELQTLEMIPLGQKVESLLKELEAKALSLNQDMEQKTSQLKALQASYQKELEARQALAQKAADARAEREKEELGWRIASFNITALTGTPDLFGFEDQVKDLEAQLTKSNEGIIQTNLVLQTLGNAKVEAENSERLLRGLRDTLPATGQIIETGIKHAGDLQQSLNKMKTVSGTLLTRAKEMKGGSNATKSVASSKGQISYAVVNMCVDALVHFRLLDEVKMVRDELVNNYGAPLPEQVADILAELDKKWSDMAGTKPVRKLKIIGATYGGRQVTADVRRHVKDDQTVLLDSTRFTTDLIPDPIPGQPKVFTLFYEYEGQDKALLKMKDSSGSITLTSDSQFTDLVRITTIKEGKTRLGGETIIYAVIYGDEIFTSTDVYNKIWDMDQGRKWKIDNESFGKDPWPRVVKTGTLYYSMGKGFPDSVWTGKEGRDTWYPDKSARSTA
ncbi:uncharacterized protein A1O9_06266 [Exophiala aquamarina CBS 119918]|uniref:Uncharacterized protein n=1 Tax=Exophiala aquamarina CBS 119918 TaxID=1182545 RepID=A0A072PS65_9EURO|nr:uncharacterized protein A1O9_06266 [Exophiala aquamarina CBS 119918]KEF58340.1 hypothetical protein A1O9_06266 [Exophiala aquamarina CBS 119918]